MDLSLHLAEGLGVKGRPERAVFAGQHHRSFLALRKQHRRWGKKTAPHPRARVGIQQVMVRYQAASRYFFHWERMWHICMCFDGSRVSGKEVVLISITGTDVDGVTSCCWAPPQDIALV